MSSPLERNSALAEQATALALELQLGLKDGEGRLQHCPLTLVPWQIPAGRWQQAQQVARAIGRRLVALAQDDAALARVLEPVLSGHSLPALLWRALQAIPKTQRRARPVNMMRVDLLQDGCQQWKLVEANTIAAGMGPFSEGLITLQQTLWPELQRAGWVGDAPVWQPNPVTAALADALIEAAAEVAGPQQSPTIAFLVEPNEDNIFDQRKLARALERKGVKVVRLTLAQLAAQWERRRAPALWVQDVGRIHALYFRTGYNLADYRDPQGHIAPLLQLRAELETLDVALAPTIPLQLASAKAVQVHWFHHPVLDETRGALDTPQFFVPQVEPVHIDWQHWLLKSQGEGGGNVVEGNRIPERIARLSAAERSDWLLMRKIDTVPRPELVPVLRRGLIQMAQHLVSELGVFITGRDLDPAGYLLRSKPAHAVETGVHRGEGAIDVLARN